MLAVTRPFFYFPFVILDDFALLVQAGLRGSRFLKVGFFERRENLFDHGIDNVGTTSPSYWWVGFLPSCQRLR